MDGGGTLLGAVMYVVDDIFARQASPPPRIPLLVEGVQLSDLHDFTQAENGHQSVLSVKRIELRLHVIQIPVGPGGIQPPEGETVIHGAGIGSPPFVLFLVDPALISDKEKRRKLVVFACCQIDGHIKLAAPVGLTLLNLLYGLRVDPDPLGPLAALAKDR